MEKRDERTDALLRALARDAKLSAKGGTKRMKTSGTPCKLCKHGGTKDYEQPCCWCISNEDIALSVHNPGYLVDFVYFEPKEVADNGKT